MEKAATRIVFGRSHPEAQHQGFAPSLQLLAPSAPAPFWAQPETTLSTIMTVLHTVSHACQELLTRDFCSLSQQPQAVSSSECSVSLKSLPERGQQLHAP